MADTMLKPTATSDDSPAGAQQGAGRAARRERSRRRILEAAWAALTERDDARVTVRDIAARAEVSPGLVMQHFETMADLILEVFMEANADLDAQLRAAAAEQTDVRSRVFSVFRKLAARDLSRPLLTARLMAGAWSWSRERELRFQEGVTTLTQHLVELLEHPEASAPEAARTATATALIAVYNLHLRRAVTAGLDAEEALARMTEGFDVVLAGLEASRGPAAAS